MSLPRAECGPIRNQSLGRLTGWLLDQLHPPGDGGRDSFPWGRGKGGSYGYLNKIQALFERREGNDSGKQLIIYVAFGWHVRELTLAALWRPRWPGPTEHGNGEELLQSLGRGDEALDGSGHSHQVEEGTSGSCEEEECVVVILNRLRGNGLLWERYASSFILIVKLADLLHVNISVTLMAGKLAGKPFVWATFLVWGGHQQALTTSWGLERERTGSSMLVSRSEANQTDGKTETWHCSMSYPWKMAVVGFDLEFVWITIPSNLLPYLVQMWMTVITSWFSLPRPPRNPLMASVCAAEGYSRPHSWQFGELTAEHSRNDIKWLSSRSFPVCDLCKDHIPTGYVGVGNRLYSVRREMPGAVVTGKECMCVHPLWHVLWWTQTPHTWLKPNKVC